MDTTGLGGTAPPPGLVTGTQSQPQAGSSQGPQDILAMIKMQFDQMNAKMDSNTAKAANDNDRLREDVQAAVIKVQDDARKEREAIKDEVLATVKGEMVNANTAYAQAEQSRESRFQGMQEELKKTHTSMQEMQNVMTNVADATQYKVDERTRITLPRITETR